MKYKIDYQKFNLKIAFYSNQLSERGTEVSLFDYAFYNRKLLNNDSYIFYNKTSKNNKQEIINKFKNNFMVFPVSNFEEVDDILLKNNIKIIYIIKSGSIDDNISKVAKNCIHCVFTCCEPHGDVYSSIHESVKCNNGKYPVVPHMINLPENKDNLRKILGIADDAIVFGGYGGKNSFDIEFVHDVIIDICKRKSNIYFIFANFNKFSKDIPNIIFLDKIVDLNEKVKFINTCDAMIHARSEGETFGIAIGEFSSKNKPVISYKGGIDINHVKLLKDKALWYTNKDELYEIFNNFNKSMIKDKDWNAYKDYSPSKVINIFKNVYLDNQTGGISNYDKVTLCMLTWNKPVTLRNTLNSYEKGGLLNKIDNKLILCQENNEEEIKIAQEYNFKILKTNNNLGIGKGICLLVDNVTTEYFLFLENDWELTEGNIDSQISDQIDNLKDDIINLYRLRSRSKPGKPLWSMISFKGNELASPIHLLESIHWISDPEVKFKDFIRKNKNIYISLSKNASWTNNPFLCKTEWFKKYIKSHFLKSNGRKNEIDIQNWWEKQTFNIGQGEGLFTHNDLIS